MKGNDGGTRELRAGLLTGEAYTAWASRFAAWARAAFLPLVLLSAAELFPDAPARGAEAGEGLYAFAAILLRAVGLGLLLVAWQRQLLLEEAPALLPRPGVRHLRVLIALLFLTVAAALPGALLFAVVGYLTSRMESVFLLFLLLPGLAFPGYLLARVSLYLPAAAVDRPLGLRQAWRTTRGEGWSLLLALALAALPLLLLALAVFSYLLGQPEEAPASPWAISAAKVILALAGGTILSGVLAAAHRVLR